MLINIVKVKKPQSTKTEVFNVIYIGVGN